MTRRLIAVAAALLIPLAACGGDDENNSADEGSSTEQSPGGDGGGGSEGDGGSGGEGGGNSGGGSGGEGGGEGGGEPEEALEACALLPKEEVSQAFGVTDIKATEDEPGDIGEGTLFGCTYQKGTEFTFNVGITTETAPDADAGGAIGEMTQGIPGVEEVPDLGDGAAYWSQGEIGEFVMVVKKSGDQLRTVTLTSMGTGHKDTIIELARAVTDRI